MDDELYMDEDWFEDDEEKMEALLIELAYELADRVFLSDNDYVPAQIEDYEIGYLEAEDWLPLLAQLWDVPPTATGPIGQLDLSYLIELVIELDALLALPGVPTEVLENPVVFLQSVLDGHLPREPSGRRVGSRKLVKIAQRVLEVMQQLSEAAQTAVRMWANMQRHTIEASAFAPYGSGDLSDLLMVPDMPPAMTGFSMMIALTLMRWPERAEGLPLPLEFGEPEVYREVLAQWEELPENPQVTAEGAGEAEALFAQGRLAHMLAQMGAVELMSPEQIEDEDVSLAYSRLSRAILWIHGQCRDCPERDEIACKVAANWPERPVPLLDVAGEIANTGRIGGCIKM
jgi:hypothetical protein